MNIFQKIVVHSLIFSSMITVLPLQTMTTPKRDRSMVYATLGAAALVVAGGVSIWYRNYYTQKSSVPQSANTVQSTTATNVTSITQVVPPQVDNSKKAHEDLVSSSSYRLPAPLRSIVDQNTDQLQDLKSGGDVTWLNDVPSQGSRWIVKSDNLAGYDYCHKMIEYYKRDFGCLCLPQTYCYTWFDVLPRICMIVEKVERANHGNDVVPLNTQQAAQLYTFIKRSGWIGASWRNVVVGVDGRVRITSSKGSKFGHNSIDGLKMLAQSPQHFTQDALNYWNERLKAEEPQ